MIDVTIVERDEIIALVGEALERRGKVLDKGVPPELAVVENDLVSISFHTVYTAKATPSASHHPLKPNAVHWRTKRAQEKAALEAEAEAEATKTAQPERVEVEVVASSEAPFPGDAAATPGRERALSGAHY
jgi:hypothetical protein